MKKKLITMALATIAIFGFTAMAQTDDTDTQSTRRTERRVSNQNKMRQPTSFQDFAFEGILLSTDQQARIDSLNNAMAEQRQSARPQRGEAPDSLGTPPGPRPEGMGQQSNPQREYIETVKEILTPDQYITFLENIVFMQQNQPQMGQAKNMGVKSQNRSRPQRSTRSTETTE